MRKILLTALTIASFSAVSNDLLAELDTSPENPKNKKAAEFATMAAGKLLSVAKSVNYVEDKTVVEVLVANQTCYVTVSGKSDNFKVSDFKCEDTATRE
jgi:hypothetical protein